MKHKNLHGVFRDNPYFKENYSKSSKQGAKCLQVRPIPRRNRFFLSQNCRIISSEFLKINGAYARFYKVIQCGNLEVGRSASHFRVSRMYLLVSFTGCLLLPGPCLSDGLLTRNYVFGDSTRLCSQSLLLDCTPA